MVRAAVGAATATATASGRARGRRAAAELFGMYTDSRCIQRGPDKYLRRREGREGREGRQAGREQSGARAPAGAGLRSYILRVYDTRYFSHYDDSDYYNVLLPLLRRPLLLPYPYYCTSARKGCRLAAGRSSIMEQQG